MSHHHTSIISTALFTTVDPPLRSSSLSELSSHTESLQTEIVSVLGVTRRVAEECSIQSISDSIEARVSKMNTLSHQLCHVTRVKLRYCQGES